MLSLHGTASVVRSHLLLALSALVLTACSGDDDGPTSVGEEFRGTWENADGTEYFVITGSRLSAYIQSNPFGCFAVFEYDLEPEGGSSYTATDADFEEESYEVELELDGEELEFTFDGFTRVLTESEVDPSDLDHCEVPPVDCDDLTGLDVPQSLDGFLSGDDIEDENGAFYDFYGVELSAATNFQVSMGTINDFSTWLGVYDEEGVELAADPGTPHSSIQIVLQPGCYIVGASSVEPGITGSYIITTSTF